jgi:hypothetical protein
MLIGRFQNKTNNLPIMHSQYQYQMYSQTQFVGLPFASQSIYSFYQIPFIEQMRMQQSYQIQQFQYCEISSLPPPGFEIRPIVNYTPIIIPGPIIFKPVDSLDVKFVCVASPKIIKKYKGSECFTKIIGKKEIEEVDINKIPMSKYAPTGQKKAFEKLFKSLKSDNGVYVLCVGYENSDKKGDILDYQACVTGSLKCKKVTTGKRVTTTTYESYEGAVKRELLEETGLVISESVLSNLNDDSEEVQFFATCVSKCAPISKSYKFKKDGRKDASKKKAGGIIYGSREEILKVMQSGVCLDTSETIIGYMAVPLYSIIPLIPEISNRFYR